MKTLIIVCAMAVLLAGCVTSTLTSEKTMADGSVTKYKVAIRSFGQDLKGSDLAASLDPEGKTTVNAGSLDNTASQITADVAKSMVELVEMMLPYMLPAAGVPVPPTVP